MVPNTVGPVAFKKDSYQFIMALVVFSIFYVFCLYPLSYILVLCVFVNYNIFAHCSNPLFCVDPQSVFPFSF